MTIAAGMDRYANNATTTLNGAINNAVTAIVATSSLGFPNPGPFRILIDNEQMQVTAGFGTTSWTVIRGVDGTAAAAHLNLAPITNNITAFDFNSYRSEFNPLSFGATANGVADDATPFQNAINDAHALTNGGHIFLPDLAFNIGSALTTYSNVVFVTYGAVLSGAGASSVTPLIRWSQLGGLTLPGALTASTGLTVTTGGATVSAGGITVTGTSAITGRTTISPSQSSGQTGLTISPAAVGTVTAETVGITQSPQTLTITGGFTNQRFTWLRQPTITAGSALTVTNAATLVVEAAPIQGGSAVLTNRWALWVQADTSRFDGTIDVNGIPVFRGTGLASGSSAFQFAPPAVGSVTAETSYATVQGNTNTITSGYATQRFNRFEQPTISAGSALTVTTAATLAVAGAPLAAGSAVITNAYALWVQGGTSKFDGAVIGTYSGTNNVPILPSSQSGGTGIRIWVQAADPGGSASEGDVWIAA